MKYFANDSFNPEKHTDNSRGSHEYHKFQLK